MMMATFIGSVGNDIATPSKLSSNFIDDDSSNGDVRPAGAMPSNDNDGFALGDGNDWAEGAGGYDAMNGEGGSDRLFGQEGMDVLRGGPGEDILVGGADDDFLVDTQPEDGVNFLAGGRGNDSYFIDENQKIEEHEEQGTDSVFLVVGDYTLPENVENMYFWHDRPHVPPGIPGDYGGIGNGLDNNMEGGSGSDVIESLKGEDQLRGHGAADTLRGGDGADVIFGEAPKILQDTLGMVAGGDFIYGGDGTDTVFGGPGDDVVDGDADDDVIRGEEGADWIFGSGGDDTIDGGPEDDILSGEDHDDRLIGAGGNDVLKGGDDVDTLLGGAGNDELDGGPRRDTLRGGLGDDSLLGGGGKDSMWGGAGADKFEFSQPPADSGIDVINDYRKAQGDAIDLAGAASDWITDERDVGGSRWELTFLGGGKLILINVADVDGDGSILSEILFV